MRRVNLLALAFVCSAGSAAAETVRLDVAYTVSLSGFEVGRATVTIDLDDNGFVATGSARSSGLIRMVSRGAGTANVRGSFKANRVLSSSFLGTLNSSRRNQKTGLRIVNGFAKEITIEPPRPPEADENRVPVTKAALTNVVDPLSAALVLVSTTGDVLKAESCNRKIPVFDGRYRFDVVLSYLRTEQASAKTDGYQGAVLVCQARYVPIAGHHRDGEAVQQMAENREMFIWLAPVAGTRVLAPVKASVSSAVGTFVVDATRFRTNPQPD